MKKLGIFVKQPTPGRVKTRLAADVGDRMAAEIYAAFTADVLERFAKTADRRFLCYAPDSLEAAEHFQQLAQDNYQLWLQPDCGLGDRMNQFFIAQIQSRADRAILIGSDSPTIPPELMNQAFVELEESDCVIGPATDGGYYLIGLSQRAWPIFDKIEWSSSQVLEQTVDRITSAGASLALLPPWYDVDSLEDLHMLRGHVQALRTTGQLGLELQHTESILNSIP